MTGRPWLPGTRFGIRESGGEAFGRPAALRAADAGRLGAVAQLDGLLCNPALGCRCDPAKVEEVPSSEGVGVAPLSVDLVAAGEVKSEVGAARWLPAPFARQCTRLALLRLRRKNAEQHDRVGQPVAANDDSPSTRCIAIRLPGRAWPSHPARSTCESPDFHLGRYPRRRALTDLRARRYPRSRKRIRIRR